MRLFESGDRIVFLSTPFFREDTFARLLRNFYFTRFPGIRLETFQSVLPPGNAELMQTLLKKEVIAGEVTGAVLHFDIRDFAPDPHMLFAPGEAGHAQRIQAMTRYHDTVEDAVKRLAEAGIPALLLSPLPPGRSRLRSGGKRRGMRTISPTAVSKSAPVLRNATAWNFSTFLCRCGSSLPQCAKTRMRGGKTICGKRHPLRMTPLRICRHTRS